jgi:hypothetical protein
MPATASFPFLIVAWLIILACFGFGAAIMFRLAPWIYRLRGGAEEEYRIGWGIKIVGSFVLGILLSVIVLGSTFMFLTKTRTGKSPMEAFQIAITEHIPTSVTILDFEHTYSDYNIVEIHFTIAPEDLKKILESEGYQASENCWKCSTEQERLGWKAYCFHTDVRRIDLCVSPSFDEVYGSAKELWL